ncbi:MAG TPA: ABC transporter ATP-binding protein [Solirubrobacteraceae bacterium]|nr:ABC transporter ATP-binding protein [Solirubrobacteraceae bacterium]
MDSRTPAVDVGRLVKVYGAGDVRVEALRGVDLTVDAGELVAIMGPSGSGKSTLLHVVGALETATSGTVRIAGADLGGLGDDALTRLRREHLGFVFQFFNLLPSLTALENAYLPALIARRQGPELRDRTRELLARVGLAGREGHVPAELSGGEQQRVSIARALLLSPQLVLADEPTGNLDSHAGAQVLELLSAVARHDGRTVVMVTHDPGAAAIADRVVFLRDGLVVSETPGGSAEGVAEAFFRMQAAAPVPAG